MGLWAVPRTGGPPTKNIPYSLWWAKYPRTTIGFVLLRQARIRLSIYVVRSEDHRHRVRRFITLVHRVTNAGWSHPSVITIH